VEINLPGSHNHLQSPHEPKKKVGRIPAVYNWKSSSLAPTATFKAPMNPKRRLEGFQLYITGNHPPWLPQPPSNPHIKAGGKPLVYK
jgi:hypothetical protein